VLSFSGDCCSQMLKFFDTMVDLLFKSIRIHWRWDKQEVDMLWISQVGVVDPEAANPSFEEKRLTGESSLELAGL